jgi:hypothetical protein
MTSASDDVAALRADLERLAAHLGQIAIRTDDLHAVTLRQKGDITRLDHGLQALADDQVTLHQKVAALGEQEPDPVLDSTSWMILDRPDVAAAVLEDLAVWVARVWSKYGPVARCWPWHPPAVSELLACKRAWQASFAKKAPPIAAADWHARWRLAAAREVTRALKGCNDTGGHRDHDTYWDADPASLTALAYWWAASNSGAPLDPATPAPGLTRKDHSS